MATALYDRLKRLEDRIHEPAFKNPKGIGSEIPHYVFDYPAEDELEVRAFVKRLQEQSPLKIKIINLFELFLSLFEDELDDLLELSEEEGLHGLIEATETVLDEQTVVVDAFIKQAEEAEVIFITGAGTAFPIMRSSQLLKMVASRAYHKPVVLFYPGQFTGLQLHLFHRLNNEDQYQLSRIS